jgi:hypothetical protein
VRWLAVAETERGGTKILRGLVIAAVIVAALVLVAAFRSNVADAVSSTGRFVSDQYPDRLNQRVAILVYLVVAVVLSVVFSRAGHFTAYGIAMGLGPLLWFVFWEGFPLLSLAPSWTSRLGLDHLAPAPVITWAVVADLVITVIFVPLELREKVVARGGRPTT